MTLQLLHETMQWADDSALVGLALLLVAGAWLSEKRRMERSRGERGIARPPRISRGDTLNDSTA